MVPPLDAGDIDEFNDALFGNDVFLSDLDSFDRSVFQNTVSGISADMEHVL